VTTPADPEQPTHPGVEPPSPSYFRRPPGPGEPFDGATGAEVLGRPLYGATFGQAIRRFFKNYARFSGRASRSEYWWSALFCVLILLIPLIILLISMFWGIGAAVASGADLSFLEEEDLPAMIIPFLSGPAAGGILLGLVLLAIVGFGTLVPSISVSWRRLHDAGLPGPLWFIALPSYLPCVSDLLAYLTGAVQIVLACLPSKPQGRRFDR